MNLTDLRRFAELMAAAVGAGRDYHLGYKRHGLTTTWEELETLHSHELALLEVTAENTTLIPPDRVTLELRIGRGAPRLHGTGRAIRPAIDSLARDWVSLGRPRPDIGRLLGTASVALVLILGVVGALIASWGPWFWWLLAGLAIALGVAAPLLRSRADTRRCLEIDYRMIEKVRAARAEGRAKWKDRAIGAVSGIVVTSAGVLLKLYVDS